MGASLGDLILAALISSGVVSAVVAVALRLFLDRRLARISEEIKSEFEQKMLLFRADREWREKAVGELLGPVYMQLERTNRAFRRWKEKNVYIETEVMKKANTAIRDLLLLNGHLIPAELLLPASELIEHYDRWLEEFERVRGGEKPDPSAIFVFAGPHGYPFPKEAEAAFKDVYKRMWAELYASGGTYPDRIAAPR
jgi:hypothetical protein